MRNPIIDVVEAHTSNFPTHDELAHHLERERGYSKDQMEYTHLRTDFDGEPDLEMPAVIVHQHAWETCTE